MQLIKTYKAVINHQLDYTLYGPAQMAEHANLKRIKHFIFPLLDKLEVGKEIPEELKVLSNGHWINLSYNFSDKCHPLFIVVEKNVLKYVTKDLSEENQSEENAIGYYDFMTDFD